MSLKAPKQTPLGSRGSLGAAATGSATGNPSNKVALKPGRSLMDWIRMGKSGKDLTGVGGQILKVEPEELAQHNTEDDAWIAIHGSVYNLTPYMEFHPGGIPELMRAAGTDGTELFEEVHKWVNAQSMLAKCYVGPLQPASKPGTPSVRSQHGKESISSKKNLLLIGSTSSLLNANGFTKPDAPAARPSTPSIQPAYDWLQTDATMTVFVYTKWTDMRRENVIIDRTDRALALTVRVKDKTYSICYDLEATVTSNYTVQVYKPSGKVEIVLEKAEVGREWEDLGIPRQGNKSFIKTAGAEISYHPCKLLSIEPVTQDTNLYCLELPEGCMMCVPTGHHVFCRANVAGMGMVRSYTVCPPSLLADKQDPRVDKGQVFYMMIKIYQDGVFTPILGGMQLGENLEVSHHHGNFELSKLESCTHLVMYAAGTGFTPMAGLLLQAAVLKPKQNRKILLVFFNKTKSDILWRDQLTELAANCDTLEVRHVLSQPHQEWTGLTGRIRQELVEGSIPTPGEDRSILFCACGPTPFTKEAIRLAKETGYTDEMTHAFLA